MQLLLLSFTLWLISILFYMYAMRRNLNISTVISLIFSLLFLFSGLNPLSMPVELCFSLAMNTLYRRSSIPFLVVIAICSIIQFYSTYSAISMQVFLLAAGTGMAVSMIFNDELKKMASVNDSTRGKNPVVEKRRDIVQIASGVLFILIFPEISNSLSYSGMVLLGVISIFILDILSFNVQNGLSKMVSSLERPDVPVGIGSIWYISGLMILMGLTTSTDIIIIGVFAMAIGDSLATIVGMSIRTIRLPYSRKKSLGGLMAMMIPTLAFAYLISGMTYFPLAIGASLVESASGYPLDDNFSIPVGIIVISYILSIF